VSFATSDARMPGPRADRAGVRGSSRREGGSVARASFAVRACAVGRVASFSSPRCAAECRSYILRSENVRPGPPHAAPFAGSRWPTETHEKSALTSSFKNKPDDIRKLVRRILPAVAPQREVVDPRLGLEPRV